MSDPNSDLVEFSFGDGDEVVIQKSNTYKGVTGQFDRVSFVWWLKLADDGMPDFTHKPKFVAGKRHYFEGAGYVRHGGPEFTSLSGKNPKVAGTTIMVTWPTEDDGTVDQHSLMKKWKVQPIVLTGEKIKTLKQLYALHHWSKNDVIISCEDSKYQKLSFMPAPEGMFGYFVNLARNGEGDKAKKAKEFVMKIMAKVDEVESGIGSVFGKTISIEDLRNQLSGQGGAGAAAAPDKATEKRLESMVDNLL